MRELKSALLLLLIFAVLTGLIYPLALTGIAQAVFPAQANGSLIELEGTVIGSALVGQPFDRPEYFSSRPSATSPTPYNGGSSMGSNLGPLNPDLHAAVKTRVASLRAADPGNTGPVPVDLVTASASGLDPHISPAAARYQIARVARARGLAERTVRELVARHTEGRQFGILGEPRVDVLRLNLALDSLSASTRATPRR